MEENSFKACLHSATSETSLFSFWKSSFVSVVSFFFYSFVLTKNPTLIEITPSNQRGNRSSVTQNNKTGECFDAMTPR